MKRRHIVALLWAFSMGAFAEINLSEVEHWTNKGTPNLYYMNTSHHVLVRADAGTSCPAGSYYLLNKQDRSYLPVDSGTCDDRKLKTTLSATQLIFTSHGKVTALYPLN
ncbi:hypothetical protein [Yersinia intermedia]|uniref:hypothetical protein n=1 Tax=Yersinia intermedia TaxID=631 RepID=UPI000B769663|nr:hypothetical protein [Yersinia intermedia]MCW8114185.1 hypothetical protein [Yersinia intermedia]MDA5518961.1 hypothetical protein [Yersinia intermedia]OWF86719.1 hypothetical protein B4916_22670 [Yersinia intermedia]